MNIVRMNPLHISSILQLQNQAFPGDGLQFTAPQLRQIEKSSEPKIYVAEMDSEFAGYVVVRDRRWRPWTSGDFLAVQPKFRRYGVAKKLVIHAITHIKRPFFRIFARPSNTGALTLYKQLGFRVVGRRRGNYSDGEDALILMMLSSKY